MKNFIIIIFAFVLVSCSIGAGTLGGFETWCFPVSQKIVQAEIDSIYIQYPEYLIPEKWKYLDDWSKSGFDFLDGKIFYFKTKPEEMYYVSFIGGDDVDNADYARIAIRAVNNGKPIWHTEDDFSSQEKERIQNRFYNEILLKLEKSSKTTVVLMKKKWYE